MPWEIGSKPWPLALWTPLVIFDFIFIFINSYVLTSFPQPLFHPWKTICYKQLPSSYHWFILNHIFLFTFSELSFSGVASSYLIPGSNFNHSPSMPLPFQLKNQSTKENRITWHQIYLIVEYLEITATDHILF